MTLPPQVIPGRAATRYACKAGTSRHGRHRSASTSSARRPPRQVKARLFTRQPSHPHHLKSIPNIYNWLPGRFAVTGKLAAGVARAFARLRWNLDVGASLELGCWSLELFRPPCGRPPVPPAPQFAVIPMCRSSLIRFSNRFRSSGLVKKSSAFIDAVRLVTSLDSALMKMIGIFFVAG